MDLLPIVRSQFIDFLWNRFKERNSQSKTLSDFLSHHVDRVPLDHFAIIELPGPDSNTLEDLLTSIGFVKRGQGYLPDKINDFSWFAAEDNKTKDVCKALPQIVLGNFRVQECTPETRALLERITLPLQKVNWSGVSRLVNETQKGDEVSAQGLFSILKVVFTQMPYQVPTVKEFLHLQKENELMAWSLIHGREVNHFGVAVHSIQKIGSLHEFNQLVVEKLRFELNRYGGSEIKGVAAEGIIQSATVNTYAIQRVSDGTVIIREPFLEFVWRFKTQADVLTQNTWCSFFQEFVPKNANKVIESVYRAGV